MRLAGTSPDDRMLSLHVPTLYVMSAVCLLGLVLALEFLRRTSDIAGLVSEHAFGALKAPIKLVTAPHVPVPFSPALEDAYIPSVEKIEAAVRATLDGAARDAAE